MERLNLLASDYDDMPQLVDDSDVEYAHEGQVMVIKKIFEYSG